MARRGRIGALVLCWKAFCYALGALVMTVFVVQAWFLAHVLYLSTFNPSSTAFMERRLEVLQQANPAAVLRYQWVPYERISPSLKRAVIAAEDARFLDHEGFDWGAIQKAMAKNE